MHYMLGLDVGTSGAKAVLVDADGAVVASATADYPLSTPQPLWSEQDPADWWQGSRDALRQVITSAAVPPDSIAGLGLTGQMHGAVFLDEQDAVIRPAILWNDGRTAAECEALTAQVGAERLLSITGNPALTGFQAPKLLWLRGHEREHAARVRRLLLPKDYLRLLLTGDAATDASDAAGTLLLDLQTRDWSDSILTTLEIPRDWLPPVFEGPQVTGQLRPAIASELGLPVGLPIVAGGGDNAAAAVGTGIIREGVLSASLGTSGVLFAHSAAIRRDEEGRLHTFCHAVPDAYHLMAVTLSAGGAFAWLRQTLRALDPTLSYDQLVAQAATVPAGAEGLLFLPYLSGERTPHRDPLARGAFIGLTLRHGLGHMVRAVLEGVAFSLRDGLVIMQELGLALDEVRLIGGGARSAVWRQIVADVLGQPVTTMRAEEGPAFGAALLAGVGAGVYPDVETAVAATVRTATTTTPQQEAQTRSDEQYAIYRTLYAALRPTFHALR